jgi:hypothetical protein
MTSTTTDATLFIELDTNAAIVEAAVKRIRLEAFRGELGVLFGIGCYQAWRAKAPMKALRTGLSALPQLSSDQREDLRVIAYKLNDAASALETAHAKLERRLEGLSVGIPFSRRFLLHLETLGTMAEDLAETAALGASEEFASKVLTEINLQGGHVDEPAARALVR